MRLCSRTHVVVPSVCSSRGFAADLAAEQRCRCWPVAEPVLELGQSEPERLPRGRHFSPAGPA